MKSIMSIVSIADQYFFMQPRFHELKELLCTISSMGYRFVTVDELASISSSSEITKDEKICVVRCDVDSDPKGAELICEILKEHNAIGTFYFRIDTLEASSVARIAVSGCEIGYHFEELATVAKRLNLRSRENALEHLGQMRDEFRRNLEQVYIPIVGRAPRTVSSHGDFVNRLLGQTNSILVDRSIRDAYGIVAEAYDPALNALVDGRVSDMGGPNWWKPSSPLDIASKNPRCLYILVHPIHWRRNIPINLRLIWIRVKEGILFHIGRNWPFRRAVTRK